MTQGLKRRARATLLAAMAATHCAIPDDDPLPAFGAPCALEDGSCVREHVCQPTASADGASGGASGGVCVPVASYGSCDATTAVTHAPGRLGQRRESEQTAIETEGNLNLIDEVRAVAGDVQVFRPGADDVSLGDLCLFRDLQAVGGAFAVGDSDVRTLDGLQSLTSVGRGLFLFDNPALTSLDALLHLRHLGAATIKSATAESGRAVHVVIVGNPALDDAAVDTFLDALGDRAQTEQPFTAVACGNRGRACAGEDDALLRSLVTNGIFSDVVSP